MKLFVVAVAAGLFLLPLTASAQVPLVPGSFEISAGGGMSVPTGDFNLIAEPGYQIGASGAFYVMPTLAIGGTIAYNSYGLDESLSGFGLEDISLSMWEFSANGKYMFLPGPVTPYAKATMGLFRTSVSAFGVSESVTDMGVGGGIGAQLRLPTSNIGFFAEGLANSVFTDGGSTNFYSIRGGINFYVSPK